MTKPTYYECHITFTAAVPLPDGVTKLLAERGNWKYTRIDGDPTLGAGVKSYATKHYSPSLELAVVIANVENLAAALAPFVSVHRTKVEFVAYDRVWS